MLVSTCNHVGQYKLSLEAWHVANLTCYVEWFENVKQISDTVAATKGHFMNISLACVGMKTEGNGKYRWKM